MRRHLRVKTTKLLVSATQGTSGGAYSPVKRLVLFEYAPSRAEAVAKDIFADFKGVLQTDAYAGYNAVLLPDRVQRIACLAHVRRKFIEIEKTCSKESSAVLSLIAELYRLDNQWRAHAPPERKAKRDIQLKPLLFKLEKYLRDLAEKTLPIAPFMEAINYTLSQWQEIMRILEDGTYHLYPSSHLHVLRVRETRYKTSG